MKVNVVQNNILVLFKQWCFQKDTIQKIYFFLCSTEEQKSYRFGMT